MIVRAKKHPLSMLTKSALSLTILLREIACVKGICTKPLARQRCAAF
jgi:hypothetical protein